MPKKEIDYKKAMIYKICCNDLKVKDIYVGSTTEFTKRKSSHKSKCHKENNKGFNFNVYRFIRDNGGWDNWSMVLVERYPCNDNYELKSRERYYIETLNAKLNSVIPNRTTKEHYNENKKNHLIQCKKYYEENKEDISKRNKQYYRKNRKNYSDAYKEKQKIKHICECGTIIVYCEKSKHEKTIIHLLILNCNLLYNYFINI
jgi:hypothetical protein